MPGAHALLSPSSAGRWLACTPSARLEENKADTSSASADEGTLAHSLSELYIKNHFGMISKVVFKNELAKIRKAKFFCKDMDNHCMDFLNTINDQVASHGKSASVYSEYKVDLTKYVPESFGTIDSTVASENLLEITDLKYGKGVHVEAVNNRQLMLYGLGAIEKFEILYGFKKVRMNIYQPRMGNFSSFEMTVKELKAWGLEIKPKAQAAFKGTGVRVPGEHCRFCKVRTSCKALADMQMQIARDGFPDPNKISDSDMADILEKAPTFINWISDIKDYALAEALKGKKWPGFKLVAGRSNRVISDVTKVAAALRKAGYEQKLFMSEPKLLGLTAIETNIGAGEFKTRCGKWINKQPGAPTLAHASDKREELRGPDAAKKAFDNI